MPKASPARPGVVPAVEHSCVLAIGSRSQEYQYTRLTRFSALNTKGAQHVGDLPVGAQRRDADTAAGPPTSPYLTSVSRSASARGAWPGSCRPRAAAPSTTPGAAATGYSWNDSASTYALTFFFATFCA